MLFIFLGRVTFSSTETKGLWDNFQLATMPRPRRLHKLCWPVHEGQAAVSPHANLSHRLTAHTGGPKTVDQKARFKKQA